MSTVMTKECAVASALAGLESFAAEKMCRKCVPCVLAVIEIDETLRKLVSGSGSAGDAVRLRAVVTGMRETARCRHGRDIATELESTLEQHAAEFAEHEDGHCPSGHCLPLLTFEIAGDRCDRCGACKEICPAGAVVGEQAPWYVVDCTPFQIRQGRCTGCGLCLPVCNAGAIDVR